MSKLLDLQKKPVLVFYGILFMSFSLTGMTSEKDSEKLETKKQASSGIPQLNRISAKVMDLGKIEPIYMTVGMATLIETPSAITGVRTGNPDAIQVIRSEKPENEVTLILKNAQVKPTNLILRSGKKKYIFDLIPSVAIHQDSLEIIGDFGGASLNSPTLKLKDSSESPETPVTLERSSFNPVR